MKSAAKLAALGIGLGLTAAGCGSGTVIVALVSPTISQVSPQVVTAGTPSVTVTVQGSNFESQSSVTVNGSAMPTTLVNSTTLAAKISGSSLAQPAVAQLQVKNSDGASSNEVPFTVTNASQSSSLAISTSGLPGAQGGSAYSAAMSASGGTPGYNWSITSGSLPAGLTLSAGGVISGTPTSSGTATFAVTVSDSGSPVQSQTVTLSIVVIPVAPPPPPALSISTGALGSAQVGSVYSASLSATGGTPNYTWSLASGTLPAGLTLSGAGVISGTPTTSGTLAFTIAATDSGSPAQSVSGQVSITVVPPGLAVRSLSLGTGMMGSSYATTLSATGGTPGYTWSIATGSLPAGLTLSSAGVISGTPTAAGTASFTVAVTDSASPALRATAQESLTISASGLSITSTSLTVGKNGSSYSTTLSATGGTPGYTWSLASGSLPAGLTLSSAGVISGTPTATGSATFTVAVNDSGSPVQTVSAPESLTISAPGLSITSTSLAAGKDGSSYSTSLNATGGTPGYTWSLASGSLPAGLTLSGAGVISGTPTGSGTSAFTVGVKDSGSPVQTATVQESLTISASGLSITSTSLAAGKDGSSYSTSLSATGGTPGYTWSLASGSLPTGLTLSGAGVISGTPTGSGTSTFTVSLKDSGSPVQTVSAQESITVASAPATLTITSTSLGAAQTDNVYSTTLSASGGSPSYTWSVSAGSLPAGLTISSGGMISGTPTASGTATFTVSVKDSGSPVQTATAQESLTVTASQLAITTSQLSPGTSGSNYSVSLAAIGGTPGYSWTVASGSLPDGLTLSSSGVVSGTPTTTGTVSFTIGVADNGSPQETATAQESITIDSSTVPTPGAAQLYLYPTAPVAPRGSYQTVTAVVSGVNDKTVTWTADGGQIVGTNPCVVNEPCTVALYTTSPGTYHLTATSNANNTVVATSTIRITASPTPVTTHPRLGGITAAMLPDLRAKAVSSNPMYMALYNHAVVVFNRVNPIWSWSCNGGSGQPNSDQSESFDEVYGYLFAFMSMIDPNDATYNWGCYGRDIWMYDANFWLNPMSSQYSAATLEQRTSDSNYGLTGNHGNDSVEFLTLPADWLMVGGYLSASDIATTRTYFALAAQEMINIQYTGSTAAVGSYNSPGELNTGSRWDFDGLRAMGNNYTHSKVMYLTAAALTFNDDTSDDPNLTNTCNATRYVVCPDGTAGSLHAYLTYLTGGMLYKDWAHMEDPSVTRPAFNAAFSNMPTVPTCENASTGGQVPCLGDGRGGESSEGSWYGYSIYRLRLALLSIYSAGYGDPMVYGPQMSLDSSSWWDLRAMSDLQFLTYSYFTTHVFSFFSTGDTLNLFRMPADFNTEAWMMEEDSEDGRTDRTSTLEWPLIYTSVGGTSAFYSNLNNDYGADNAIPLFVSLPVGDPTSTPIADPRVNFPTDLYNGGNQHVMVRSGWDAGGTQSPSVGNGGTNTVFSYYCANSRIDHEHETCGGFDVLSDGEFITKTRTVFNDYNMMLATAEHSNLAGYGNDPGQTVCTLANSCYEYQAVLGSDGNGGGQLWHGQQAGPVTLLHAELSGYVAAIVDTTALYNGSASLGWGSITGVTAASRSLVYLRGANEIVYYDRGAGDANSKRVWVTTTGPITISNNTATWLTRSKSQSAYVTSLLPAGAALSDAGAYMTAENGNPNTTDWEPYSHLLIDAGNPAATQFLTVLQWGAASATSSNAVLVQSTAGQNFDGSLTGSSLVMFMRNWPNAFTNVTYPASGATTQYISDLAPNTTYSISGAGAPSTATTDKAGVLVFSASGTGNITVTSSP